MSETRTLTAAQWLDIRTALLAAAQLADAALLSSPPHERAILNKKRWDYLNLARELEALQ